MAASAPKKAAKKAATPRELEARDERDYSQFIAYRDRALAAQGKKPVSSTPFVLGVEQGFDPPIEIVLPKRARDKFAMDELVKQERLLPALQILVGQYDFGRICDTMDAVAEDLTEQGDPTEGTDLVAGLIMRVFEHFSGKGSHDVPGGSEAS